VHLLRLQPFTMSRHSCVRFVKFARVHASRNNSNHRHRRFESAGAGSSRIYQRQCQRRVILRVGALARTDDHARTERRRRYRAKR